MGWIGSYRKSGIIKISTSKQIKSVKTIIKHAIMHTHTRPEQKQETRKQEYHAHHEA